MRIILNYHQILKQYGLMPEFYNIPTLEAVQKRSGYPLRPGKTIFLTDRTPTRTTPTLTPMACLTKKFLEFAESLMYLYRATEDPLLLQMGAELVDAIEHSAKTKCGYATVRKNRKNCPIFFVSDIFFFNSQGARCQRSRHRRSYGIVFLGRNDEIFIFIIRSE